MDLNEEKACYYIKIKLIIIMAVGDFDLEEFDRWEKTNLAEGIFL